MAQITRFPLLSHIRTEPSQHVLRYRGGKLVANGRGLAFWFRPIHAAIVVIPGEDLDIPFLFHGRSKDYQEVNVQGVVTYRVADPVRVAERVDFAIDVMTGMHRHKPLERVAGMITELSQQLAADVLAKTDLQALLNSGSEQIRQRMEGGLLKDVGVADMGVALVSVRVSLVSASAEMEKALRVPVREAIQQDADEATFRRRAQAVEKERAIQENELQNKIELSKREEQFIQQRGTNERKRAIDEAESARIASEGKSARHEMEAKAQAVGIRAIEEAKVVAERERMLIYREFPPERLMALAVQELASKLNNIGQITVTPDHVGSLLKQLGLGNNTNTASASKGA